MIDCNLDCFNCTKPDCDKDFIDMNSVSCKRWYDKNREKKLEHQRAYNARKRQNKKRNVKERTNIQKEITLLKFRELDLLKKELDIQVQEPICEVTKCARCGRAKEIKARGLCASCYVYAYKYGKLDEYSRVQKYHKEGARYE